MAKAVPPKERHFRVTHTQVAGWPKGRIISDAEILEHKGASIERLIRAGAIVETTLPVSTEPLPAGPFNEGADSGSEAPPILTAEHDENDVRKSDSDAPAPAVTPEPEPVPEMEGEEEDEDEDEDEEEDDGRVPSLPPPPGRKKK